MKKLIMFSALAFGLTALTGCCTFTKATVIYGNTNVVYDVVAWWDRSDKVQLWVKDESSPRGLKVLLTHYSRVILENPNPKCDPKF